MNILVTGANGQLGTELRIVCNCSKDKYIFTDVSQLAGHETVYLDITDLESIRSMVRENSVDCIVNCAAYTNVDAAESDADTAEKLNASAVANLAMAMKEVNGLLIHISTDYIFGKEPYNTPCREDMIGTPVGVYGRTKLQGENHILDSGVRHLIIRTAWLYSEYGKNFCKTMLALTASKESINVVFDQVGTPTYAYDLAQVIYEIIENRKFEGKEGVYHYSNEGVCSWFDFAKVIAEYAGHHSCEIRPCHSSEFPSPVRRPSYSVLDKTKIKEAFGLKIPYWMDSLKKCIENITKQSIS